MDIISIAHQQFSKNKKKNKQKRFSNHVCCSLTPRQFCPSPITQLSVLIYLYWSSMLSFSKKDKGSIFYFPRVSQEAQLGHSQSTQLGEDALHMQKQSFWKVIKDGLLYQTHQNNKISGDVHLHFALWAHLTCFYQKPFGLFGPDK